MLEFLKENLTFVAMACICGFGVIGKLLARHCYQMLLRQSENISTAKNKFLRQIKSKYEGVYRINRGVKNTNAFVKKQLYRYRYGILRLETLDNFSAWGAILCFAIGVGNSCYLMRSTQSLRVLAFPVGAGILAAAGLILIDRAADNHSRRQELISHVQDYLENNVSSRMESSVNASAEAAVAAKIPESDSSVGKNNQEKNGGNSIAATLENSNNKIRAMKKREEKNKQENISPLKSRGKEGASLKKSLEQVAASKEEGNSKQLSQEEQQLMDEIIREYLS